MELLVSQKSEPDSQRTLAAAGIENPAITLDLDDTSSVISDISKVPRVPGDGAQAEDVIDPTTVRPPSMINPGGELLERLPSLDEKTTKKLNNGDLKLPTTAITTNGTFQESESNGRDVKGELLSS